jgi:N-acetylmuramoyl-L-alanine amidase
LGNIDHLVTPRNCLHFINELGNIEPTMDNTSISNKNIPRQRIHSGRMLQTTLSVALILATLFTAFPPTILTSDFNTRLSLLLTPQPQIVSGEATVPAGLRIGIISGHWGGDDPGTVCLNGVTEQQVNLKIATIVQQQLNSKDQYQVDLLQEEDSRLIGYQGVLLVSIHNDSCVISNEMTTGFKIAPSSAGNYPDRSQRLADCLFDRYQKATLLPYHPGSITPDMTDYHAFREINPDTSAAIIETSFLSNPVDYALLTEHPDIVATGIVNGILCYLNNETVDATPTTNPSP